MNRITGMASGLDVDALVKSAMQPYNIKVDKAKQQKAIIEIKQSQYRALITEAQNFQKKYLSIASSDSLLQSKSYSTVKFESNDSATVKVNGLAGAKVDNYTVNVTAIATAATATLTLDDIKGQTSINVNGKPVDVINVKSLDDLAKAITDAKVSGITATNSQFSKGVVIQATELGSDPKFKVTVLSNTTGNIIGTSKPGSDVEAVIKKLSTGETFTVDGTKNQATLDGVQFNFTSQTNGDVKISGSKDVSALKDKIVKFVDDYNTLMEKLNSTVNTRHNKNYAPLTDDQKKDMSTDEIKVWNDKVEEGQLNRDSDISRITRKMKSAMSALVGDSGINLKKIGIVPSGDNAGDKNGTFNINDADLTKALEDNAEGVMEMFTKTADSTAIDAEKYNQTGLLNRLKDIFNEEVQGDSPLIKKSGLEGSRFVIDNPLTKSISDYEKKITDMQKSLATREQTLYSKYASLETILNKYNSQQSSFTSMFGGQ